MEIEEFIARGRSPDLAELLTEGLPRSMDAFG
jgi:hypothetical protein